MTPLTTRDLRYFVISCIFHCRTFAFARSCPGFDRQLSPSVLDILPPADVLTPRSGRDIEHALVTTLYLDPGMCPWQHFSLICVTDIFCKSLLPRRCSSTTSHWYTVFQIQSSLKPNIDIQRWWFILIYSASFARLTLFHHIWQISTFLPYGAWHSRILHRLIMTVRRLLVKPFWLPSFDLANVLLFYFPSFGFCGLLGHIPIVSQHIRRTIVIAVRRQLFVCIPLNLSALRFVSDLPLLG